MMTLTAPKPEEFADHVVPRHSPQSARLKGLMDEADAIRASYESGRITAEQALNELAKLKSRHRSVFQRVLGL